jgi:hypothetical protein
MRHCVVNKEEIISIFAAQLMHKDDEIARQRKKISELLVAIEQLRGQIEERIHLYSRN